MKQRFLSILLAGLLTLSVTGCGGGTDAASTPGAGTASAGGSTAAEETQVYPDGTMTIYAYGQPQYLQIYFDDWLERNRDIAPGVSIEIVQTKDVTTPARRSA